MTPPVATSGAAALSARSLDAVSAPTAGTRHAAASLFLRHLDGLAEAVAASRISCAAAVADAAVLVASVLRRDGCVLTCGNGGSAAEAQHLTAELVGRMGVDRRALRSVALTADAAVVTALGNDYGYDRIFSRQVEALGRPGDVLIGFSVSGRSPNVLAAIHSAKARGLSAVLITGSSFAATAADVVIAVDSVTSHVQELHLAVTHALCEAVEQDLGTDFL